MPADEFMYLRHGDMCEAINNTDAEVASCISQGPYNSYLNESITNPTDQINGIRQHFKVLC